MRSMQIYRALDQIPNRFALCMKISRGVRSNHKIGNSMGSTVTSTLAGIESKALLSGAEAAIPALMEKVAATFAVCPPTFKPFALLVR